MPRMLMLLSAPRSYSSLISMMIGQHPNIYAFPELHLMLRETVGEVIRMERGSQHYLGPPGLLRALAELVYGGQNARNVLSAANWIEERRAWRSAELMDFMIERAGESKDAGYCLEKTPFLVFLPSALKRVKRSWPDARYIHVTRHPVTFKASMDRVVESLPRLTPEQKALRIENTMALWSVGQRNVIDFCESLRPEQYLRFRSEDVLKDAPQIMGDVANWLGLNCDDNAVDAMMRPEESPYATLGPANAPYGNDPDFVTNPAFRPNEFQEGSLTEWLEGPDAHHLDTDRRVDISRLADLLGYH